MLTVRKQHDIIIKRLGARALRSVENAGISEMGEINS
jgi:hypothetical protein